MGLLPDDLDLTGLPDAMALKLGIWAGEQVNAAEARGFRRAVETLRDDARYQSWHQQAGIGTAESGEFVDWDDRRLCADFLESLADQTGETDG